MSIRIVEADLNVSEHRDAVLAMVDAYSRDTMGSAKPLDPGVRLRLIPGLQRHPTTLIFLAFEGEQPVGFPNNNGPLIVRSGGLGAGKNF